MASFRIETLAAEDGMVFAEVFHEPGLEPIVRSAAIYHSHDEAEAAIISTVRQAWPDTAPLAVDPSIGV